MNKLLVVTLALIVGVSLLASITIVALFPNFPFGNPDGDLYMMVYLGDTAYDGEITLYEWDGTTYILDDNYTLVADEYTLIRAFSDGEHMFRVDALSMWSAEELVVFSGEQDMQWICTLSPLL